MPDRRPVCWAYCRVSTEGQAQSGMGLEAQKETIRKYYEYLLQAKGFAWSDYWIDPAVSGSIPFGRRKAGGELDLKMDRGDALVVAKVDRAFRGFFDAINQMEAWEKRGIAVHFLDLNIDTGSPVGKAVFRVLAAFAELERSRMRERLIEANRQRRLQGKPTNGKPPYGYTLAGPPGKRHFRENTYEQKWGKKIVEMRDSGYTFREIWRWLWINRVPTRKGNEWSISRVIRVYHQFKQRMMKEGGSNGSATT